MLKIAICDDENVFRNDLISMLIKYTTDFPNLSFEIDEYSNGNELISITKDYDIVFLDYQMPNMNGIEVAKTLRKNNSLCSIIFVTNYPEFAIDAFEVNTFRYLLKPIDYKKLCKALNDYRKIVKQFSPFLVTVNNELHSFSSKDVIYMEASGKYCTIRLKDQTICSSKTLSQVLEQLPQNYFYRVHRTYVVNFFYIESIHDNIITFTNGEKAIISKRNISDFNKAYRMFILEESR